LTDQDGIASGRLVSDQSPRLFELPFVIRNQKANENVRVDADHQRDSCSIGTGFRPFLRSMPASARTLLFFTRMSTVPSGMSVNVIRSPDFMASFSRIPLGIVV
jgi:hypothetical protein